MATDLADVQAQERDDPEQPPAMIPPPYGPMARSVYEQWVQDEFTALHSELERLYRYRRNQKGQPTIYMTSAGEVLKAHDAGVIDRAETRKLLGLARRRQPAQLRAARARRQT